MAPGGGRSVRQALGRAHITGPHRTLTQDLSFGIDQLVEIAIRALSPAVNDTFTALTCIDWLGESLCKIDARWHPARVHRDGQGYIRVITADPSYDRLVQRAFEKIRQSSLGMPAVMIRQLEALANDHGRHHRAPSSAGCCSMQAAMIERASERSVPEAATGPTPAAATRPSCSRCHPMPASALPRWRASRLRPGVSLAPWMRSRQSTASAVEVEDRPGGVFWRERTSISEGHRRDSLGRTSP